MARGRTLASRDSARADASAHPTPASGQRRDLAWVVLVAAVLQVVAPVLTALGPGASPGDGAGAELLITPVGWAFSIWGVIYTLAIVQAVAALAGSGVGVSPRFQVDQVVLYLAAVLWIFMAALDSSTLTFLALALMFGAAVDGILTLARTAVEPRWFRLLTRAAFGLFAGWVSAAFFLNLSTALVGWGVVSADDVAWQLVVVAAATLTLVGFLLRTRLLAYAAAGLWALVGIVVTGATEDTTAVVVGGATAIVALGAAVAVTLRGGVPHRH